MLPYDEWPITSQTPTTPHLAHLIRIGEHVIAGASELTTMFSDEALLAEVTDEEFTALRHAASAARTAGSDTLLIAASMHSRYDTVDA